MQTGTKKPNFPRGAAPRKEERTLVRAWHLFLEKRLYLDSLYLGILLLLVVVIEIFGLPPWMG